MQAEDIQELAKELHSRKFIDLDQPIASLLEVEGIKRFDPGRLGWGCIFGSGYVLIYSDFMEREIAGE